MGEAMISLMDPARPNMTPDAKNASDKRDVVSRIEKLERNRSGVRITYSGANVIFSFSDGTQISVTGTVL